MTENKATLIIYIEVIKAMPRRATDNIPTLLPAKPDSYLRLKNSV